MWLSLKFLGCCSSNFRLIFGVWFQLQPWGESPPKPGPSTMDSAGYPQRSDKVTIWDGTDGTLPMHKLMVSSLGEHSEWFSWEFTNQYLIFMNSGWTENACCLWDDSRGLPPFRSCSQLPGCIVMARWLYLSPSLAHHIWASADFGGLSWGYCFGYRKVLFKAPDGAIWGLFCCANLAQTHHQSQVSFQLLGGCWGKGTQWRGRVANSTFLFENVLFLFVCKKPIEIALVDLWLWEKTNNIHFSVPWFLLAECVWKTAHIPPNQFLLGPMRLIFHYPLESNMGLETIKIEFWYTPWIWLPWIDINDSY